MKVKTKVKAGNVSKKGKSSTYGDPKYYLEVARVR